MSKDCDQLSVRDAVHTMRNQLMAMRGNAQLLIRRLEREAGGGERNVDACQTIVEQIQLIELALAHLIATSPQLLNGAITPNVDRASCPQDLPARQSEARDVTRRG